MSATGEIRTYNGPKAAKKCSSCGAEITIGDRYWRGIEGVTRACLDCGYRMRDKHAADAAEEQRLAHEASLVDRRQHRNERRAAIFSGDILG